MLKELRQVEEARSKFLLSCQLTPLLWAAWLELATGCRDREDVSWGEKHCEVQQCLVDLYTAS